MITVVGNTDIPMGRNKYSLKQPSVRSEPMMSQATYTIPAMDCPAEERLIRARLGAVKGIEQIECDVFNSRLTVMHTLPDEGEILTALADIGMNPTDRPQQQAATGALCGDEACVAGSTSDVAATSGAPPGTRWLARGPLVLSGAMAVMAEGLALAGVSERDWPVVAISLASIALGGLPTLRKGLRAVRVLNLNINFLMTVAVAGACVIGAWPEAAMVTFLFAVAELIEAKALDRARNAVRGLMAMVPDAAEVKQPDGSWKAMPADHVPAGTVVRVKPGERLALDGLVVAGESGVNQAPVTGESVPVDKGVGDKVFAGTINESGVLEFQTTGGKDQTTLAKIIRTVQEAQGSRAPTQRFVDRFAGVYTPVVCIAAVLVALLPWAAFGEPFMPWLYRALVLLVIACPCALVISTPVTVVSGLTAAARRGILIKGGVHLENGRKLKVVALDKTGTVTEGKPRVTDVQPIRDATRDDVLRTAASLDVLSQHPVAQAVVAAWPGERQPVTGFKSLAGRGVEGTIGGDSYFVGNHRLAEERGVCSPEIEVVLSRLEAQGKSTVVVASASRVLGVIAVADTARESSVEAIRTLHGLGIQTLMLSGDNQTTADAIARTVGIDRARGGMLPEDKLAEIEQLLIAHGDAVGMVGDGVNDAPALAKATIGVAMGAAGTDTALETADVALMQDDLRGLPEFVVLSRRTGSILTQNIAFAIGIKTVFFALAVFGAAAMWMAVIADVGASLLVIGNGLRLLRGQSGS